MTTPEAQRHRKDIHILFVVFGTAMAFMVIALVILVFMCTHARAHDMDPEVTKWMEGLMQPQNPTYSCCSISDAYWADVVRVRDGKVYAVITDDRPDEPLRSRHHVPLGTEVLVPPEVMKHDRGNPTGHAVIFLNVNNVALCYVQGSGI